MTGKLVASFVAACLIVVAGAAFGWDEAGEKKAMAAIA